MNSAISLRGFNEYRNRVRAMSDEDLVKAGKQLHWLSATLPTATVRGDLRLAV